MEIKDKLNEAEEIKQKHKKGKHGDQHKCKEVQKRGQEEDSENELKVEIKDRLDEMEGVKVGHKMERMHKVIGRHNVEGMPDSTYDVRISTIMKSILKVDSANFGAI